MLQTIYFCLIFVHLLCVLYGEYLTYSEHSLLFFLHYNFDSMQVRYINDLYLLISFNGSLGDFIYILTFSKLLRYIDKCTYAYI